MTLYSKIKELVNVANGYILLMTAYTYLHLTNNDGTIFTRIIILINIIVSMYCMSKISNNKYLKRCKILLGIFTLYGTILMITEPIKLYSNYANIEVYSYWYLLEIFTSILPIFSIYYFSIKKKLTKTSLSIWLIIYMMLIPIIYRDTTALIGNNIDSIYTTNKTSNIGYAFISILPAMGLLTKKVWMQYVLLIYCMVFCLICMKRGPMIICIIYYLLYFLYQFKNLRFGKKIVLAALSCVIISLGWHLFVELQANNIYFEKRIYDTINGETSGRNIIYSTLFDYYINETNLIQKIIGCGAYGTLKVYTLAHNDWLEILLCQGVIGIGVYLWYWHGLFNQIIINKRNNDIYLCISAFFCIYFLKTLFSMSYNDISIFSIIFFSYYLAKSDETLKQKEYS